jgi:hypothetical protein
MRTEVVEQLSMSSCTAAAAAAAVEKATEGQAYTGI